MSPINATTKSRGIEGCNPSLNNKRNTERCGGAGGVGEVVWFGGGASVARQILVS